MYRDIKQKGYMPKDLQDPTTPPKGDPEPKPKAPEPFSPTKLSDEDLAKVLEDPRIWKTDRIAELLQAKKELKKLEDEKAAAEKADLEKKGEFEKLSKQTQAELDTAKQRIADMEKLSRITNAAVAKGIQDVDAASKLIDMSGVKVDADGNYTGIDEAVEALVKARPYLVDNSRSVGTPSNPGVNPAINGKQYKMSEIGDPKFYQENREDIQKAQVEGRIVEDRNMNGPQPTPGK
jgi:hypothetical protein